MEPMAGLDAKFLYSETSTVHMHTLKVAVIDLNDIGDGLSYDVLLTVLERQLDSLPPFRRRLVTVPLGLGHPVWVEDPDFRLSCHVTRRTVSAPGGLRELADVVADVARTPLPRDRPLWSLVVVEGLADHRMAVVAKVHHAVADGAATVALLENVFRPDRGEVTAVPWRPEPLPDRRALLAFAAREHLRRWRGLPRLAVRSVSGLRRAQRRRRQLAVRPPLPYEAPRTSFNVSVGAARTFAMTSLPLDALRRLRKIHGATLNDVFLAVCGGALRDYLYQRDELPNRPLVAAVPVSTDPTAVRLGGNRVDNLFVTLGTDIADPAVRLAHIHRVAVSAKDIRAVFGSDLLEERAAVVPPQLYAATVRAWAHSHLSNITPPPLNVVISSVPGPRRPLRFGPAVIDAIYSVGPILEGIGLNLTAWSYGDALYVAVLGSPASVPDPWLIADALAPALAELVASPPLAAVPAPAGSAAG